MNSQLFTEQNDSDLNKTQYSVYSAEDSVKIKTKKIFVNFENLKFSKTSKI